MGHLKLFLCSLSTRSSWLFVIRYPRNSWEDPIVEVMVGTTWLGREVVAYHNIPGFIEETIRDAESVG